MIPYKNLKIYAELCEIVFPKLILKKLIIKVLILKN